MTPSAPPVELAALPAAALGAVLDALEDGLVLRDASGAVVAANAAARALAEWAPGLLGPGRRGATEHPVHGEGGVRWIGERRSWCAAAGLEIAVLRDSTATRAGEDELTQALAEMNETYTVLELTRARIERRARLDPLTGVANRRHIESLLAAALAAPDAPAVLLLDLDRFKDINDRRGHAAGDAVLTEVVRRVAATVPAGVEVGRWGGEEFLVIVPGTHPEPVAALAERIRAAVRAEPVQAGAEPVAVTVSIGVAVACDPRPAPAALVAEADAALYEAKHTGRDRVAGRCAAADTLPAGR
jgi:diguanylate cyclase (GGDEF)-like protein